MSFLSPSAAAILNTIQASAKTDAKPDAKADANAFLSLLGGEGSGFSAGAESEGALVDTLYAEDEEPQAVAAPVHVPTELFVENKDAEMLAPARTKEAAPAKDAQPETPVAEAAPVQNPQAPAQEKTAAPQEKNTENSAPVAKEAPAPAQAAKESPAVHNNENKTVVPADLNAPNGLSLAEKLRSKIDELSTLLSSLASMMGIQPAGYVQVVQVTQTTLRIQQSSLGIEVNQPFVDLSKRFEQMMAAINSAQHVPADIQQPLSITFSSFHSLIFTTLQNPGAPADMQGLAAQSAACQTNIGKAMQALPEALSANANMNNTASGSLDVNSLMGQLQKLTAWVSDFQKTLTSQQIAPATLSPEQAAGLAPVQTASSPLSTATAKEAVALAPIVLPTEKPKTPAEKMVAEIAAAPSAASAAAPAQTPNTPANNNAQVNTQAAVAVAENAAGANANMSSGQGDKGQGGERQQTAPVGAFSQTSAASNASGAAATSFNKALRAASSHSALTEQVAFNIKTAAKSGDSRIEIQLDPLELGKLRIKMDLSTDGKASNITITADNKATLDLLQRDARGLENALADAGIKAESGSLSFNLRGEQQQQQDEKRQAFASYAPLVQEEDELAPLAVVSRSYVINMADGLDIKI